MAVRGENSLFFATGLDNTGLEVGASQATSIISRMGSKIAAINPFAALGIGALAAFGTIAAAAFRLAKEFETAMKEVQTISEAARADFKGISTEVFNLSQITPEEPKKLAEAYYQIVSAGYDGAKGLKLLETASKAAIAGVTDTETAADGITTIMNAFQLSMEDVDKVADSMFKTVELGKTTFDQIASSISTVAPLAASMGVSFDEVLAAVASLTKQGVPTAQAMTQIRAGLIGVSEVLGDGWAEAYTLQDAFGAVAEQANGSQVVLRELVGRVEAVSGILGVTGKNAEGAAKDLKDLSEAAGAVERAFAIQMSSNTNQWTLFSNQIKGATRNLGEFVLEASTGLARTLNFMTKDFNIVSDAMSRQSTELNVLKLELNESNTSAERRKEIVEKLVKQYPDYLGGLDSEKSSLNEINEALEKVNENLINRLVIQLKQEEIDKEALRGANQQVDLREAEKDLREEMIKQAELYNIPIKEEGTLLEKANALYQEISDRRKKQGPTSPFANQSSDLQRYIDRINGLQGRLTDTKTLVDELTAEKKQLIIDLKINTEGGGEADIPTEVQKKLEEIKNLNDTATLERFLQDGNSLVVEAAKARIEILENEKTNATKAWKEWLELLDKRKEAYEKYEDLVATLGERGAEKFKETLGISEDTYGEYLANLYDKAVSNAAKIEIATRAAAIDFQIERKPEAGVVEDYLPVKRNIVIETTVNPESIEEAERIIEFLEKQRKEATEQGARDAINTRIEQYQEWIKIAQGEADEEEDIRVAFFNSIKDLRARDIRDQLNKDRARLAELLKDEVKNAKEIKKLKADISAEEEALADKAIGVGNTVSAIFADLSRLFSTFGNEDLAELMTQLQGVAEGAGQLAAGLAKGGNPLDIIAGATKILQSAITIEIASDTAKFEKAIKALRRSIDDLDYAISRSIGDERIANRAEAIDQLKELEEQAKLAKEAEEKARKEVKFLGLTVGSKGEGSGTDPEKILELEKAAEDARRKVVELNNEINEIFTGTTSGSIVEALVQGFEEGKNSARDFASTFEDLMKGAVLESLKIKFLEKAANQFFEDFADAAESGGGLDSSEILALRNSFGDLVEQSNRELEALNQILQEAGIQGGIGGGNAQRQGLVGEITTITEETATILAGTLNGIRVDVNQGLVVAQSSNLYLSEIAQTLRSILEENEVSNVKLTNIERNLT